MIILTNVLTVMFAWIYSEFDSNQILGEKYIYREGHKRRAILRFFVVCFYSLLVFPSTFTEYFLVILINCSLFWITFDIFMNCNLNKHFLRLGKTSWTDRFLTKVSFGVPSLAFAFKIIIFLSLLMLYLIIVIMEVYSLKAFYETF